MQSSPRSPSSAARLDNLPLGTRARCRPHRRLLAEQLLERLSQRLDLLKAGRDADPRQQTLRATIEWSYDLLDDDGADAFRALSVFAGGCTYEAAEAVCAADPDTLQSLLDKSLLRRRDATRSRYWMLETIRELAAEKLTAEGEADGARRRHAEHYLAVARSANLDAEAEGQQRHDLAIPERDNMRAALTWALETEEREVGLELVVALENYWATNGSQEGRDWAAVLLEKSSGVPDSLVLRALRVQGGMENMHGSTAVAEDLFSRSLAMARTTNDERAVAVLLHRLANTVAQRGDWQRVQALAEESLAGHRRIGFPKGAAQALTSLADVAIAAGELEHALELLGESGPLRKRRLSVVARRQPGEDRRRVTGTRQARRRP